MIVIDTSKANSILLLKYDKELQQHLDNKAKEYGYDDIYTAISYSEEPSIPKFQTEGRAFREWRSLFWLEVNNIKNEVLNALRPIPSVEEIIQESPKLTLQSTQ